MRVFGTGEACLVYQSGQEIGLVQEACLVYQSGQEIGLVQEGLVWCTKVARR